ncbi:MAG TPA: sigma-70 family RNA polymerase sigma factor [Planctomycetaceae bacterium]|nr:sigma-70 family RNA polymerase sigma factor [Planctomycetaceae bacterium]
MERSSNQHASPAAAPPRPGDEFVQLFTRNQRRLFLYILSQVPHPVEAEEILQETNLVIWKKCDQFQPGTHFVAWARRIARLEVLKFLDRRQRERLRFRTELVETIAEEAAADADPSFHEERRKALAACLGKLSPRDRRLIEQRYAPGTSGKTLAEQLGRPANSVYQSLGRIRRALLECISRRLAEAGL